MFFFLIIKIFSLGYFRLDISIITALRILRIIKKKLAVFNEFCIVYFNLKFFFFHFQGELIYNTFIHEFIDFFISIFFFFFGGEGSFFGVSGVNQPSVNVTNCIEPVNWFALRDNYWRFGLFSKRQKTMIKTY